MGHRPKTNKSTAMVLGARLVWLALVFWSWRGDSRVARRPRRCTCSATELAAGRREQQLRDDVAAVQGEPPALRRRLPGRGEWPPAGLATAAT